jgi:hypothetical protein
MGRTCCRCSQASKQKRRARRSAGNSISTNDCSGTISKPKPFATEAARHGKWKLLARDGVGVELFDIEADPKERHDLSAGHPDVVAQMEDELRTFLAEPRRSWRAVIGDE